MLEYIKWKGKELKDEEDKKNHKVQVDGVEAAIEKDQEFVKELKKCFKV